MLDQNYPISIKIRTDDLTEHQIEFDLMNLLFCEYYIVQRISFNFDDFTASNEFKLMKISIETQDDL